MRWGKKNPITKIIIKQHCNNKALVQKLSYVWILNKLIVVYYMYFFYHSIIIQNYYLCHLLH